MLDLGQLVVHKTQQHTSESCQPGGALSPKGQHQRQKLCSHSTEIAYVVSIAFSCVLLVFNKKIVQKLE